MSERLRRKMDWEGRHVALKFDMTTNGGAIFKAGDVMLVERNFGGLQLRTIRNCKECGQQNRLSIIKVREQDVELLPKSYIPSDHISRNDFLQAELAAAQAEIERLQTWLDEAQSACKGLGQTADNFGARLNAARAEVERLRVIIRKVEWVGYTCAFCGIEIGNNHSEYCPFYQWEGGAS